MTRLEDGALLGDTREIARWSPRVAADLVEQRSLGEVRLSVEGPDVTASPDVAMGNDFPATAAVDGVRWIEMVTGVRVSGPASFAPDGTVWFVGPSGIQRVPAAALPAR